MTHLFDSEQQSSRQQTTPAATVTIAPGLAPIPNEDYNESVFQILSSRKILENEYLRGHARRYFHCVRHMPHGKWLTDGKNGAALELGTSFVFPFVLKDMFKFGRVDFTDFGQPGEKSQSRKIPGDWKIREWTSYNVNLEEEPISVHDESYDLVICFEVIEHMEKDPMYMIAEINRILKPNGVLFMTTPNSTSARNVYKILHGYAPHFFMKYSKAATLYRHNVEYAPHQIKAIVNAGGFSVRKMWSEDLFEAPMPEIIDLLSALKMPVEYRGDNILVIAEKAGPVKERYPAEIYF
ncbi:methyltransferase domain-containing protein [Methylosinus sp. PW1]|uniref:methyltransferase domain-containing protein n=1 Tax=Methylosinus sp. PW1 TaxID=107636 RepID=UPI00056A1C8C|nr:methyltransferase domain-containing protein [Methylosinus sp. PW1]